MPLMSTTRIPITDASMLTRMLIGRQMPSLKSHPSPLRDDDCAICQLFTRPVEVAVVFCWENVEVQAEALVAAPTVQLTSFFESGYEVRGPPTSV